MVVLGIALIPIIATAALGIDLSRAYLAKTRLQSAIDAASIAMASSSGSNEEIEAMGKRFFYANYPEDFWAPPAEPVKSLILWISSEGEAGIVRSKLDIRSPRCLPLRRLQLRVLQTRTGVCSRCAARSRTDSRTTSRRSTRACGRPRAG